MTDDNRNELTPQARAAKVTYMLTYRRELTTRQICEVTGLTDVAVRYMMNNLSLAGVPVYKPGVGRWALLDRRLGGLE